MAHYDIRTATMRDYETQCKNIANIINNNYSEYLTAEASLNSENKYPNYIIANEWMVEISLAKGERQEDIVIVYGAANSSNCNMLYFINNSPTGTLSINKDYCTYTNDTGKVFCLDILEINNGLLFGFYGTDQSESISSHGYKIELIIAYNENNDCVTIVSSQSSNNTIYVDKGNNNIDTSYSNSTSCRIKTLPGDIVQFNNFFDGDKFLNNVNLVIIGQSPSQISPVRSFSINGQDYYYLKCLSGYGVSATSSVQPSFVFPLPSQSS